LGVEVLKRREARDRSWSMVSMTEYLGGFGKLVEG
jgi:hypothetical protein